MTGSQKISRLVAINGGPRKTWNTAALLSQALSGARKQGAATEMIHLYDLNFKGCVSCFACKTKKNYKKGVCAHQDDLSPVLDLVMNSTAIIMGSPIYLGDVTGALRSFMERFVFMNLNYDLNEPSVLAEGPAVGLVYTMNVPEKVLDEFGYTAVFKSHLQFLKRLNGPLIEYLTACDTYQFDDYDKYHAPMFDAAHKKKFKAEQFPQDLEAAFQLGSKLVTAGKK